MAFALLICSKLKPVYSMNRWFSLAITDNVRLSEILVYQSHERHLHAAVGRRVVCWQGRNASRHGRMHGTASCGCAHTGYLALKLCHNFKLAFDSSKPIYLPPPHFSK